MNEFRQHTPAFFEGTAPPLVQPFASTEALLAIPWVAAWRAEAGFRRYSQSPDGPRTLLVAEFDGPNGRFWVLGFLREPVDGLPEWVHPGPEGR